MSIDDPAALSGPRQMVELDRATAMSLLAQAGVGRIVFTEHALPAVRVVNHLVDNSEIIIRTGMLSALGGTLVDGTGTVVAYEADDIDPLTGLGWSVVVTGIAAPVSDANRAAGYQELLQPWVTGAKEMFVSIQPQIVTGFQLTEGDNNLIGPAEPRMPRPYPGPAGNFGR